MTKHFSCVVLFVRNVSSNSLGYVSTAELNEEYLYVLSSILRLAMYVMVLAVVFTGRMFLRVVVPFSDRWEVF